MSKFVLKGKKLAHKHKDSTGQTVIRISTESYNTLVDMANESILPISTIASKAIMFAFENLEIDRE